MSGVTCAEVRRYLESVQQSSSGASVALFAPMQERGAVEGSAPAPKLTAIGEHVLSELNVRAYRLDARELDDAAAEIGRVQEDLDAVAKTAEYFLAELGPVTPAMAVPLLRPVAVGLASRREPPEDLAEEFRNAWGSVEVMGGDPRDRLLAAELLNAADLPTGEVYAPIMTTMERIRAEEGSRAPSVTVASILHLLTPQGLVVPVEAYRALREKVPGREAAALLAAMHGGDTANALMARDRFLGQLSSGGAGDGDVALAATYLASVGAVPDEGVPRTKAVAEGIRGTFDRPFVPAAVLAAGSQLEPPEILNWFAKAQELIRARKLAPTEKEIGALAVGLVHGLPPTHFGFATSAPDPAGPALESLPPLLALHRWVYRPLTEAMAPPAA